MQHNKLKLRNFLNSSFRNVFQILMIKICKYIFLASLVFLFLFSCNNNQPLKNQNIMSIKIQLEKERQENREEQDKIINEYLKNGAWNHKIYSPEWQEEINRGLAKDSTIAYLWQQKAMPMFKFGKYEVGMIYIDKAVKYNRKRWQPYRAFIKCIFAKTYAKAITDFQDYKAHFGYGYIMDHSFDFYIGLSYLQLNEFKKAEEIFQRDFEYIIGTKGENWLHYLDLYYYGITEYEQGKYHEAIEHFNMALKIYPNFSDAQFFKAECLKRIGKKEESNYFLNQAKVNAQKGNTINEANAKYETYPYHTRWL